MGTSKAWRARLLARPQRRVVEEGTAVDALGHPALDDGTIVTARRHAPRPIRKAFATLRD
jgi:hypothetical protein